MKRSITAIIIALTAMALSGCAPAVAAQEHDGAPDFKYVHDWSEPRIPSGAVRIAAEQAEKAAQEPQEAVEAPVEDEWGCEDEWAYYEPQAVSRAFNGNPDGLNSFDGVYEYGGRTESFYSSNALYHRDTAEWTVDEQGFYRTDEGYYVVASSDYEHGTVIETSQGKSVVLDDGCDSGVVDFYVSW